MTRTRLSRRTASPGSGRSHSQGQQMVSGHSADACGNQRNGGEAVSFSGPASHRTSCPRPREGAVVLRSSTTASVKKIAPLFASRSDVMQPGAANAGPCGFQPFHAIGFGSRLTDSRGPAPSRSRRIVSFRATRTISSASGSCSPAAMSRGPAWAGSRRAAATRSPSASVKCMTAARWEVSDGGRWFSSSLRSSRRSFTLTPALAKSASRPERRWRWRPRCAPPGGRWRRGTRQRPRER